MRCLVSVPLFFFFCPVIIPEHTGKGDSDKGEEDEQEGVEDEEEARIRALVFGKGESGLLSAFGAEADGQGWGAKAEFNGGFYEGMIRRDTSSVSIVRTAVSCVFLEGCHSCLIAQRYTCVYRAFGTSFHSVRYKPSYPTSFLFNLPQKACVRVYTHDICIYPASQYSAVTS